MSEGRETVRMRARVLACVRARACLCASVRARKVSNFRRVGLLGGPSSVQIRCGVDFVIRFDVSFKLDLLLVSN